MMHNSRNSYPNCKLRTASNCERLCVCGGERLERDRSDYSHKQEKTANESVVGLSHKPRVPNPWAVANYRAVPYWNGAVRVAGVHTQLNWRKRRAGRRLCTCPPLTQVELRLSALARHSRGLVPLCPPAGPPSHKGWGPLL